MLDKLGADTMNCKREEQHGNEGSALPTVSLADLIIEDQIGEGSFSDVFLVRFKQPTDDANNKTSSFSLAMKCPKTPSSLPSADDSVQATEDLLSEASILATLDHKNIIQAIGMSKQPAILLMELLDLTLEDRLLQWREQRRWSSSSRQLFRHSFSMDAAASMGWNTNRARLAFRGRTESIVRGVASGMEYLHSKNVILRDLKPENLGFDLNGQVKIFDFGFACYADSSECRDLAGSLRYMSPEVLELVGQEDEQQPGKQEKKVTTGLLTSSLRRRRSNDDQRQLSSSFASDIYAFGIVLYELATLEKAFHSLIRNVEQASTILVKKVSRKGWRPSTRGIPNQRYRKLVEACWDPHPMARPSFERICNSWLDDVYPSPVTETKGNPKSLSRGQSMPESFLRRSFSVLGSSHKNPTGMGTRRTIQSHHGCFSEDVIDVTEGGEEDVVFLADDNGMAKFSTLPEEQEEERGDASGVISFRQPDCNRILVSEAA